MAEEQAKWYIIHTYSGYEAIVKDNLEKPDLLVQSDMHIVMIMKIILIL